MQEAVMREMLEETGLEVDVGDVVWVGELIEDDTHLVLLDFEATWTGGDLRAGDDADEAAWVRLSEAESLPLTRTMYSLIGVLNSD